MFIECWKSLHSRVFLDLEIYEWGKTSRSRIEATKNLKTLIWFHNPKLDYDEGRQSIQLSCLNCSATSSMYCGIEKVSGDNCILDVKACFSTPHRQTTLPAYLADGSSDANKFAARATSINTWKSSFLPENHIIPLKDKTLTEAACVSTSDIRVDIQLKVWKTWSNCLMYLVRKVQHKRIISLYWLFKMRQVP